MAELNTVPVLALDSGSEREAREMIARVGATCTFYKIGSELFTAAGPDFVRALVDAGNQVFLDLKFHDIPNTVERASAAAVELGVSMFTVHGSGGSEMVAAAVRGAGGRARVIAVTVLTSHDSASLGAAWGRTVSDIGAEAGRLGGMAIAAGAAGVVCSGLEVLALRRSLEPRFPGLDYVVPGVRLAGSDPGDQRRTVTPREAADAGATHLVLGRTVTGAAEPAAAWSEAVASLR